MGDFYPYLAVSFNKSPIFFWDPMETQAHDSDVKALLRLGCAWNIPMATDRASADFIMTSPLMNQEYETIIPDYSSYL